MPIEKVVYTVTQINRYVKSVLSQDENLKYIYVRGEISNFKYGANGHLYFSLKDEECLISVVMFATYASKIIFSPKNGDEVIVLASIDSYPARGTYQLTAFELNQIGQGTILIELEKLKKKLQAEGLFDISRKREINIYPRAIGVITALNGAAIKDIVTNIKRRYPIADILIFPSSVQGENAPKELYQAFLKSQEYDLDTLIIGRGGGASEDLSAFNDEKLVRAIAQSKMPVIAAVGHEIDSTLVDYVADKRASTPTGAAEMATVDRREIEQHFIYAKEDMDNALKEYIDEIKESIDNAKENIKDSLLNKIENLKMEISNKRNQLDALNPENVLKRGYTLTVDKKGNIIDTINNVNINDELSIVFSDGKVTANVKDIVEKN